MANLFAESQPLKSDASQEDYCWSQKKELVWSDDEVELLLSVAADYKAEKAAESIDRESVKSKYKDILDLFLSALPEGNSTVFGKNFPHKRSDIKLKNLTSKLKEYELNFVKQ